MNLYDWLPTDSAPRDCPMRMVSAELTFADGDSFPLPDKKVIHKGWGTMVSTYLIGEDLKPIPNGLNLSFFSYWENCFYAGTFKLPHDNIETLFKLGYYSPKLSTHCTYNRIMVGVAPGGGVAVWLLGIDRCTEVFFGKAAKVDIPWTEILDNPHITREEYVHQGLVESLSPETYARIVREGLALDSWEQYHQERYYWSPNIALQTPPRLIHSLVYFNGEVECQHYPERQNAGRITQAVPMLIKYYWKNLEGHPLLHEIFFDEAEIRSVFKHLASFGNSPELPITILISSQIIDHRPSIKVDMRCRDQTVRLEKVQVKQFLAKDAQYDWSISHPISP